MVTINVSITTVNKPLPTDPGFGAFDHYQYFLENDPPTATIATIESPGKSVQFVVDIPPGNYNMEVKDIDVNGTALEPNGVRVAFTVPSAPGTFDGVDTVTVNLS